MAETRRAVSLHQDDVRNARADGRGGGALLFDMPFNDKSERIREGDEVVLDGVGYLVSRKEDLRPPLVADRTIEFRLVPLVRGEGG